MAAADRSDSIRFLLWHLALPLALALGVFVVFEFTDLDRSVSDLFYAPADHAFPLRHEWFFEVVLHQWAKYLLVLLASAVFGGFVMSFAIDALRPLRRRWPGRAAAALAMALLYGLLLGLVRVMQGSLFLSYALWSAIVVWFVVLIIYWALLGRAGVTGDG